MSKRRTELPEESARRRASMIELSIPGYTTLLLEHLVMDYNGSLALDGVLLDGVAERLLSLSSRLHLHVVTADTFGFARAQLDAIPCALVVLPPEGQAQAKLAYIQGLGEDYVFAIGNGRNDQLMLRAAAVGVAIVQGEGAAMTTCVAADMVVPSILAALDLLLCPKRLVASLRG